LQYRVSHLKRAYDEELLAKKKKEEEVDKLK
jgi:hypothetical protein